MSKFMALALVAACSSTMVATQVQAEQPAQAAPVQGGQRQLLLPAGTEIRLTLAQQLSSRRNRAGDSFELTVADDVRIGEMVVIRRGTRAMGEIVRRSGRGAFGRSGKMSVALRHIELDGIRVPILGTYRRHGEGATLATIGAVALVGVLGAGITGSSAQLPAGYVLTATLAEPLPLAANSGLNAAWVDPAYQPSSPIAAAAAGEARARAEAEDRCRSETSARRAAVRQTPRSTRRCVNRAMRPPRLA